MAFMIRPSRGPAADELNVHTLISPHKSRLLLARKVVPEITFRSTTLLSLPSSPLPIADHFLLSLEIHLVLLEPLMCQCLLDRNPVLWSEPPEFAQEINKVILFLCRGIGIIKERAHVAFVICADLPACTIRCGTPVQTINDVLDLLRTVTRVRPLVKPMRVVFKHQMPGP